MNINTQGWLSGILHKPSPNYNARPTDLDIDLLVIHNISLPPGIFSGSDIIQLFQNTLDTSQHAYYKDLENLKVSSHFLIRRDGEIIQFVSVLDRAWHAGKSIYQGTDNCNDFSIGIELEGTDTLPFEQGQYESLIQLTQVIQARFPKITNNRITGHSTIAPGRKTDPGPYFEWQRYLHAL